jgi:hypothetical protein
MWKTADERVALLELLSRGTLKRRRAQGALFEALSELPWTRATGRRDKIGLVEDRRHELGALEQLVREGALSLVLSHE